ncbi:MULTISPECIES: hypothetical protein [unclassified Saccharopolyspora]|uniref:hypothetical protein n=1 Tax=unclassified Saccharopolyspora TaxID=2646250 RepID=UPI001CD55DCD|nr:MULTISPECIES: hypothetical protein [unclassified Saccharopolyspora]MCA1188633.1 hypothetical protein [Saccharopolyspora sp. 6T]MCA1227863.1 hypothetical protein [Saccharopolyspora sp. 6M]
MISGSRPGPAAPAGLARRRRHRAGRLGAVLVGRQDVARGADPGGPLLPRAVLGHVRAARPVGAVRRVGDRW